MRSPQPAAVNDWRRLICLCTRLAPRQHYWQTRQAKHVVRQERRGFIFMETSQINAGDPVIGREPIPLVENWRYKRARDLLIAQTEFRLVGRVETGD